MSRLLLGLGLALVAGSGCHKIVYVDGGSAPFQKTNARFHHIGILGLVEFSNPVPVHQICPSGFERIDVRGNALTWLLSSVTYNFYSPNKVYLSCSSGSSWLLGVDDHGAVAEALELDLDGDAALPH